MVTGKVELGIFGLLVLGALLACGKSKSGSAPAESSASAESAAPAGAPPTIKSLLAAYKTDEPSADRQFKGKQLSISGTVVSVSNEAKLKVTIANTKDYELPSLQCNPAAGQEVKANALAKGDSVTVQGTIDGAMMNVILKDCQIVSSTHGG